MATSTLLLGCLLAVGSGAGWTGLDAIRKRLVRDLSPLPLLLGLVIAQLPVHVALVAWGGLPEIEAPFFAWTALAAAAAVLANVLLIMALRDAAMSMVVPLLSFTPVFTLLTGWALLGQQPTALGAVGMVGVVGGALLLDAAPAELLRDPLRSLRARGSRLALAVAAIFAFGNAIDRRAVLHANEPLYAAVISMMIALALLAVPGVRRELLAARGRWTLVAGGGLVMAAALLLHLFAFRLLPVATVDAVKRTAGNAFAVGFGRAFFREGQTARRLLAAGLMSAGVALLLLG